MLRRKRATIIVKTKEGVVVGKPWFIPSYRLIGGGVKQTEDFLDAGKRELLEETGIKTNKLKYLFDFTEGLQDHKVYLIELKKDKEMKMNWENWNIKYIDKDNFMKFSLNKYSRKILERYFGI